MPVSLKTEMSAQCGAAYARPSMLDHPLQLVPRIFARIVAHIRSHIDPRRKLDQCPALLPVKRLGIEDES